MTFNELTSKNFKYNSKKYFSYFLCSTFSIALLFIYSTLFFNKSIIVNMNNINRELQSIIKLCFFGIIVFSLFFISYAHSSFVKSRNKEFGLFLTLGMTKKDINKIIIFENGFIGAVSIAVGLIIGTIFSKLFFMVVVKLLKLNDIVFNLNYKSYIVTTIIFTVIFIFVTLISKRHVNKSDISKLIKSDRACEFNKMRSPVWGFIAVIGFILSYIIMVYNMYSSRSLSIIRNAFIGFCIVLSYVCILILISQFSTIIMFLRKKNRDLYYKNIFNLSEVNTKLSRYKKVIFALSIIYSITIIFNGLCYSAYAVLNSECKEECPYDLMYIESNNENIIKEDELLDILNKSKTPLTERIDIKSIGMNILYFYDDVQRESEITVLCEDELSKLLNLDIDIKQGKTVIFNYFDGYGDKIKLKNSSSDAVYEFNIQEKRSERLLNWTHYTNAIIVLDKNDYKHIIDDENAAEVKIIHLFNFKNWKDTTEVSNEITQKLMDINGVHFNTQREIRRWYLRPVSRCILYNELRTHGSFNTFMISFVSILFFISSGVMLYFKVYADLDEAKMKYSKLIKIGITYNEIKKCISKELRTIFFVPIILGSILGYSFICTMADGNKMIKIYPFIVIGVYFVCQYIFYLLTKKKYVEEIVDMHI